MPIQQILIAQLFTRKYEVGHAVEQVLEVLQDFNSFQFLESPVDLLIELVEDALNRQKVDLFVALLLKLLLDQVVFKLVVPKL